MEAVIEHGCTLLMENLLSFPSDILPIVLLSTCLLRSFDFLFERVSMYTPLRPVGMPFSILPSLSRPNRGASTWSS